MICEITRKMTPNEQMCYEMGYKKGKLDSVVRGHWISEIVKKLDWKGEIHDYYQPWSCSVCHSPDVQKGISSYCSNCGTKMEQEATE